VPDALVVSRDTESTLQLEAVVRAAGLRVKSCLEIEVAEEWCKLRRFAAVIVDGTISVPEQQKIAGLLWDQNPVAPFFSVTHTTEKSFGVRDQGERLFGAETLGGPSAYEDLRQQLEVIAREREGGKLPPLSIMVVEDLDAPRDIICSYIENLGYAVAKDERSAAGALQHLESMPGTVSCIITDIRMPDMNGRQLIEVVRQHPKLQHLPIIVLTAYGTADMLIDCLKAGASGFLTKPPKKGDLVRELARAQRIIHRQKSPRLASSDEADALREILAERGFY